jgi:hypothetical protein
MKNPKRPCAVCRVWYIPEPRTRHCQKTCGKESCRREWTRRQQSRWRSKNPDYWSEHRLRVRATQVEGNGGGVMVRPPPKVIEKVPWDVAEAEFGVTGTLFVAFVMRLLLRSAQTALTVQPADNTKELTRVSITEAQTAINPRPPEDSEESTRVSLDEAQTAMASSIAIHDTS